MNYDPNMLMCGRRAKQAVKLIFANGRYRFETIETVHGNVGGANALDAAIDTFLNRVCVEREDGYCAIDLAFTNSDGDTLLIDESDDDPEEALRKMLIGFEILSIEPETPPSKGFL